MHGVNLFLKDSAHCPSNGRSRAVMVKNMVKYALVVCGVLAAAQAQANFPTVPKETYEALKIERSASPKELYEALLK